MASPDTVQSVADLPDASSCPGAEILVNDEDTTYRSRGDVWHRILDQGQADARYSAGSEGGGGGGGGLGFALWTEVAPGFLAADTIFGYFRAPAACRITALRGNVLLAPSGADLTVDLVDGSDEEQSKVLTIAAGSRVGHVTLSSALALSAGDVVKFKITGVGSSEPGDSLSVTAVVAPPAS